MHELPPLPGRVVLREAEAEAWRDGYRFLDEARRRSERLEARIARETAAARAEGFAAGQRDGAVDAAALLAKTTADVDAHLAGLERELADLVLVTVRRVLSTYDDRTLITHMVREALADFRGAHKVTLHVPQDVVQEVATQFAAQADTGGPTVHVCADARLAAGQCVLATEHATMTLDLDTQLDRLRLALYGERAAP